LKKALTLMSGRINDKNLLFNPIVVTATKDQLVSRSAKQGNTVFGLFTFNNFVVNVDEEELAIPMDVNKIIQYLSLAESDDEVTLRYDGKTFTLETKTDDCTIPGITIDSVKSNVKKPPFAIEDGVALYKSGTVKPTTRVDLDVSMLKDLIDRAKITKTDYYPLEFTAPNVFTARCGDELDRRSDSIKTVRNNVTVEGDTCNVVLSNGFEEVFGILDGLVKLHCKSAYPVWIVKETPDYTASFFLAPRKELQK